MKTNIKIILVSIIVISLLSLNSVNAVSNSTITGWNGDTLYLNYINNNWVYTPPNNNSISTNLTINEELSMTLLQMKGNITISLYDNYSAITLFSFSPNHKLSFNNESYNTTINLFYITVQPDNTTVNIDGKIYKAPYTTSQLIISGSGLAQWHTAYLYYAISPTINNIIGYTTFFIILILVIALIFVLIKVSGADEF